jgi:hypothetical protein
MSSAPGLGWQDPGLLASRIRPLPSDRYRQDSTYSHRGGRNRFDSYLAR